MTEGSACGDERPVPLTISVIIPTLNEASRIAEAIDSARRFGALEVIVVDGGSTDDTWHRASAADVRLTSPPGRAIQQNLGARQARGDVLVFLHADCRLPGNGAGAVRDALCLPRTVACCFEQAIDAPDAIYRAIERGNAWRVRLLGWAYGDQAIGLTKATFLEIGMFDEAPFLEDWKLSRKLLRRGRWVVLPLKLTTSARRWQSRGVVRQTLRNWAILACAWCGVSPARLARWYASR